jgi:putative transposase
MWRNSRLLSVRFRLYPSRQVEEALFHQLNLCRWLYNRLLEELGRAKTEGRQLSQKDTQAFIVKLKKENPELRLVYSKVLQMVNYQLWSNIYGLAGAKKSGRKVGRLRFKGRWFKTLNFNQSGFRLEGKKLCLSKVGTINVKMHRSIEGDVKGVFVKRELSGRWFAIFQCQNVVAHLAKTDRVVGLDVGVKHFLSDSDGKQIENPKFYEKSLERLQKTQRVLSRKKKGSKNRAKARVKLARAYEKVVNQRDDFLHKLSRFYVNNYDMIAIEELNVAGMVKNHTFAKRILDASWSRFFQMLSYKAENAGRTLVKVNPRGTSREYKHGELDRDYNASLNILERGLAGLGRPLEPVEVKPLLPVAASVIVEAGSPHPSGQGSSPKAVVCKDGGL